MNTNFQDAMLLVTGGRFSPAQVVHSERFD